MLPWLTQDALQDGLRVLGAALTAFVIAVVGGKWVIAWLRRENLRERTQKTPIEDEKLREQINAKSGTPTMGGLIIIAGLLPAVLLWSRLTNLYLWLALACFAALAVLGVVDDRMKLAGKGHRDRGLKVRYKLLIQGAIGCGLGMAYWHRLKVIGPSGIPAPLLRDWILPLGPLVIIWAGLVVATMSNAVNVTDGLDGLAGGLTLVALVPLGIMTYGSGKWAIAGSDPGLRELALFCAALGGAVLGFLWHNWHPARVFMGDTGSLAIGGGIGLVAVMSRVELLLPLLAFVFLVEFGSSVLQVLWFKATGRRILPIAPIHHLFQQKGWPERDIVASFLIIAAAAGMCALIFV